jgi:hypothetical protein
MVVTVAGQSGRPYSGLAVYAFDRENYTGFNGTTDAVSNTVRNKAA